MKVNFKRTSSGIAISLINLTQGEALALANALRNHKTPVGEDLRCSLRNTLQIQGKTNEDQDLFSALTADES
jgi:hypothetical protein